MINVRVTGSEWVDGSGWRFTENLDPIIIDSLDDLVEAAQEYAKEWVDGAPHDADGTDYQLRFYPEPDNDDDDIDWDSPAFKCWISDFANDDEY